MTSPNRRGESRDAVRGILLRLGAVAASSVMGACVKHLDQSGIPIGEAIFVRCTISVAVIATLARHRSGLHLLATRNWKAHVWRSSAGTVGLFTWFAALTLLPLADVTAILFASPLFTTVLALFFLGERIRSHHWLALVTGLVGVIIMIGPYLSLDANSNTLGVLLALASAMASALAMIFLRGMSGDEHPLAIAFYFSLMTLLCAAFTAPWGWPAPTVQQWAMIVLASLLGVTFQLLLTVSYRYATASTLASLEYTSMIVAVLLGYFVFGEIPGLAMWIGGPLVIHAGLLMLWREYRLQRLVDAQPQ